MSVSLGQSVRKADSSVKNPRIRPIGTLDLTKSATPQAEKWLGLQHPPRVEKPLQKVYGCGRMLSSWTKRKLLLLQTNLRYTPALIRSSNSSANETRLALHALQTALI